MIKSQDCTTDVQSLIASFAVLSEFGMLSHRFQSMATGTRCQTMATVKRKNMHRPLVPRQTPFVLYYIHVVVQQWTARQLSLTEAVCVVRGRTSPCMKLKLLARHTSLSTGVSLVAYLRQRDTSVVQQPTAGGLSEVLCVVSDHVTLNVGWALGCAMETTSNTTTHHHHHHHHTTTTPPTPPPPPPPPHYHETS